MDIVRADGARYSEKYKMPRSPLPSEQAQVHGVRRLGYRITANICAFGWKARDFALKRVDCKTYSLAATERRRKRFPDFSNGYRMGTGPFRIRFTLQEP